MNGSLLYIATAAMLWGSLGVVASLPNAAGYSGLQVAALRVTLSAILLSAAVPLVRAAWQRIRRAPLIFLAHAALGVVAYNLCYFQAIEQIGVVPAVGLLYTAPLWTLLFMRLLFAEPIARTRLLLASAVVCGVGLLLGIGPGAVQLPPGGLLVGLGAGASYALYYVIGKRALENMDAPVLLVASFLLSAGLFMLLPATWMAWTHLAADLAGAEISVLLALGFIALAGTVLAYALFLRGLQHTTPATVSIITTLEPLTAALLGMGLLGIRLTTLQWLGFALIVICNAANGLLAARQTAPACAGHNEREKR